MMRVIAGQSPSVTEEFLAYARQLGLSGVQVNTPDLPGAERWEYSDLVALRRACEDGGLRLEAIENIPVSFYRRCMLGEQGRDHEIENVRRTIEHIARAGIPILGYHWMPLSVWRTSIGPDGRGGSVATTFDALVAEDPSRRDEIYFAARDARLDDTWVRGLPDRPRPVSSEQMWDNYVYFMERVLPVAENCGLRLALHPDDPPVPYLDGVARIFSSVQGLAEGAAIFPSQSWAVDLCLGTVSEMGGEAAVMEAITALGRLGKIAYVHLRDVIGTVPKFSECFLGEGNYDPLAVLRALRDVGFDSFILDDHVPRLVGDSDYHHRARGYAIGYIQGLLRAVADA
jgi:mannonate dehydratase